MFLKMASSLEIQIANEFLNSNNKWILGFGNTEIVDFGRLSDLEPVPFGARTMPPKKLITSPACGRSQHKQHYPPRTLPRTYSLLKMNLPERKWNTVSSNHQCLRAELLLLESVLRNRFRHLFFSPLVGWSRLGSLRPQLRWGDSAAKVIPKGIDCRVEMGFLLCQCDPTKKGNLKHTHLSLSNKKWGEFRKIYKYT